MRIVHRPVCSNRTRTQRHITHTHVQHNTHHQLFPDRLCTRMHVNKHCLDSQTKRTNLHNCVFLVNLLLLHTHHLVFIIIINRFLFDLNRRG